MHVTNPPSAFSAPLCPDLAGQTCVRALLAAGASVNATDSEWWTPLMLLAGRGSCGVLAKASLLLAQPALHLDPSDSVSGQETVEEALAVKAGQLQVATMIREEVGAPSGPCVWLARARQQAV